MRVYRIDYSLPTERRRLGTDEARRRVDAEEPATATSVGCPNVRSSPPSRCPACGLLLFGCVPEASRAESTTDLCGFPRMDQDPQRSVVHIPQECATLCLVLNRLRNQ